MDKSSGWLPLNTALIFWISLWNTIKPNSIWKNCSQKIGNIVMSFQTNTTIRPGCGSKFLFSWIFSVNHLNQFTKPFWIYEVYITWRKLFVSMPIHLNWHRTSRGKIHCRKPVIFVLGITKGRSCVAHIFTAVSCPLETLVLSHSIRTKTISTNFTQEDIKKESQMGLTTWWWVKENRTVSFLLTEQKYYWR